MTDRRYPAFGRSRRLSGRRLPDASNATNPASNRPFKSRVVAMNAVPFPSIAASYGTAVALAKEPQRKLPFASTAKIPPAGGDQFTAPVMSAPPETGWYAIGVGATKAL